jgi:hypothetical protein
VHIHANYRGTSFFAPGRKKAKPNLFVSELEQSASHELVEGPMNKLPILPTCAREGGYPVIYVPISIYVPIRRLPSVLRIFTTVKKPLQINSFYAKQTQFPKGQNEHKCC